MAVIEMEQMFTDIIGIIRWKKRALPDLSEALAPFSLKLDPSCRAGLELLGDAGV